MMKREGIGGSDTPTILGLNKYQSPLELWERKTGRRAELDFTSAMQRGTALEAIAATLYAQKTGRKLRRVTTMQRHPEHEWMTGNFDREIIGDDPGPGILEIKCPGLQVFGKARREGLPAAYNVQLQHYLSVSGRKWGAIAVFNAERWELVFFDVSRDEVLIDVIIAKDAEFHRCVVEDRPPLELNASPVLDLPTVGPSELVRMDSSDWRAAVDQLREAREIKTEAEALEDQAKEALQKLMNEGGAQVAEGGGARIYNRLTPGRVTVDSRRLAREMPDVFEKYAKKGEPYQVFKPYFLRGE